ncbi:MAG: hypothetical protein RIT24_677 [Planctomycetota bacterium]|jgi:Peptidase family S51
MMGRMKASRPARPRAIVLGPQRHVPIVKPALEALGVSAKAEIAFVSAGWEERESEDGEFREHVGRPVRNLEIWGRVERIFAREPQLLTAMRQRHDALRRAQELYRLRLEGLVGPARALLVHEGDPAIVKPELDGAIAMVKSLDDEHCKRIAELHREFDARVQPKQLATVREHRAEIEKALDGAHALCVAGGHVGVLLHRLDLFDVVGLWGERPIVAWSAGAMALSERIVLFHHGHSMMGSGVDAEVMEAGIGALPGIVALPHARKRLDLHDRVSLQLLSRRMQPAKCVLLDDGDRLDWDGAEWREHKGGRSLDQAGKVVEARA